MQMYAFALKTSSSVVNRTIVSLMYAHCLGLSAAGCGSCAGERGVLEVGGDAGEGVEGAVADVGSAAVTPELSEEVAFVAGADGNWRRAPRISDNSVTLAGAGYMALRSVLFVTDVGMAEV
jgi:hypothetical protein